jgi:manganese oxidase
VNPALRRFLEVEQKLMILRMASFWTHLRTGMMTGVYVFLIILALTGFSAAAKTSRRASHIRHYYIAAEDVVWDFAPSGRDLMFNMPIPPTYAKTRYKKMRFIEYTDQTFTIRKTQLEWLGILGPIIRAEVGDTVIVHFRNRSSRPLSMHPHGLRYVKSNEGAPYIGPDGRSVPPVLPGDEFTYTWIADESSGPRPGQPSSILWQYHSHVNEPMDVNDGLIGPIIVTAKGKARPDGSPRDVNEEFVALFMVFDHQQGKEPGMMHAINGYIFGNLPGLVAESGDTVRWHVFSMGNERDVHTAHWHGQTVFTATERMDVVSMSPATSVNVDMHADNPGDWMFQCHVADHIEGGMMAFFSVLPPRRACPATFGPGDFWKNSDKVDFQIKNSSKKTIKTVNFTANIFIKPSYLTSTYVLWKSEKMLAPGNTATYEFPRPTLDPGNVLGWVVYPIGIEYTDGTKWIPKTNSECFHVYWQDGSTVQPRILPPIQTTGIKREEKD